MGLLNVENWELFLDGHKFKLPLEGIHNARNFMLALAVAIELNIPLDLLSEIQVTLPSGRDNLLRIGGVNVLDETYNASPEAMYASLELLISLPRCHFAVLGKMLELGLSGRFKTYCFYIP